MFQNMILYWRNCSFQIYF